MEKILFINACVRPGSRTRMLAECVLESLDGMVEEVNLEQEAIPPLNQESLNARNSLLAEKEYSAPMLRYARQFAEADVIVMAAPYWDLSFPATVKAYIEAVTAVGVTFVYTPEGRPAGLCKAQKLIYVTTAGGFIGKYDFGFGYVKTMAQEFYGIEDVTCVRAEGLDIDGADIEEILKKAEKEWKRK